MKTAKETGQRNRVRAIHSESVAVNRALNSEDVRMGRVEVCSVPLQVNIDLTGVCNINPPCVFCSGKNFGHNYPPLPADHLKRYAYFLDRCSTVNDDSFGEPLTHPKLLPIANEFILRGQRFNLVTNGLLLRGKMASGLADCGLQIGMHVSFNAATSETYYKLTGRNFLTLVENVDRYVRLFRERNGGDLPNVTLTFIVMKVNRHVPDFLHLTHRFGLNALLAPLHDRPSLPLGHFGYAFEYAQEMLPYSELKMIGEAALNLAREIGVHVSLQWDASSDTALRSFSEPGVDIPCLIPWRFLFIQEHSRGIFACPYHRHPIDVLVQHSPEDVWNGMQIKTLRQSLVAGEIPKFCWNNSAACPLIFADRDRGIDKPIDSSIDMGVNDYWHLEEGWHPLEHLGNDIRWTSERATFRIRYSQERTLRLLCTTWKSDAQRNPCQVRLQFDGRESSLSLDKIGRWYTLVLPLRRHFPGVLWRRRNVIKGIIRVDNPWRPSEMLDASRDTRSLGVMVKRVWLE
jgi:MoaA/NifB/PqqE/SkfB family radical SAM enzyme